MKLEGIMLSEISRHRQINTAESHLYEESDNAKCTKQSRILVVQDWQRGKWKDIGGQR
jgi:hypothetical protein